MDKILFMPLTKVVELPDGTVEVYGRTAAEEPDPQGEVFDYEASKPFIKAWSDNAFEASGGKSLGNLRAMHNPRIAAGIVTGLDFLDEAKAIDAVAKVVDAEEVKKVRTGVYTGFSWGGSYGPKRQVGDLIYYAAVPTELSLADNPMIKSARFTLVKVDGSEEQRAFVKVQSAGELQKRLSDVAQMAGRLYDLRCLLGNVVYEAKEEQDGSTVPARLQAAFLNLLDIFKDFAAEEAEELTVNVRALLEQPAGEMTMNQAAGGDVCPTCQLQKLAAGVRQGGMEKMATLAEMENLVKGLGERLEKIEGAFTAQGEQLIKVEAENADLKDRLTKVEAQPAAPKGNLKAVAKGDDIQPEEAATGPSEAEMIKNKDTQGLIKAAHSKPIALA